MISDRERRVQILVNSRKKYAQFTKSAIRRNSNEDRQRQLRDNILSEKLQMLKIENELADYKEKYGKILESMGEAHRNAKILEESEKTLDGFVRSRNEYVKKRANRVLNQEIQKKWSKNPNMKQRKDDLKERRESITLEKPDCQITVQSDERI